MMYSYSLVFQYFILLGAGELVKSVLQSQQIPMVRDLTIEYHILFYIYVLNCSTFLFSFSFFF